MFENFYVYHVEPTSGVRDMLMQRLFLLVNSCIIEIDMVSALCGCRCCMAEEVLAMHMNVIDVSVPQL